MEEIGSMSTLVGWLQEIVPGKYSEETGKGKPHHNELGGTAIFS